MKRKNRMQRIRTLESRPRPLVPELKDSRSSWNAPAPRLCLVQLDPRTAQMRRGRPDPHEDTVLLALRGGRDSLDSYSFLAACLCTCACGPLAPPHNCRRTAVRRSKASAAAQVADDRVDGLTLLGDCDAEPLSGLGTDDALEGEAAEGDLAAHDDREEGEDD